MEYIQNLKLFNNRFCRTALAVILFTTGGLEAQVVKSYTLDSLQTMARQKYPLAKQLQLSSQYGDEAIKAITSNWLPKASFVGGAALQSEVTRVSLPSQIPVSIDSPAKDQYKTGFELTQLIYDGGVSSVQKDIEKLNTVSEKEKTESELLKIRSSINDLFAAILINKESHKILNYVKSDLNEREKNIGSAVESGLALKSTKQELEAEIKGIDQKIIENETQLVELYTALSTFVQEKVDTSALLILPVSLKQDLPKIFSNRPEYRMISTQIELTGQRKKLINRSNMPKIAMFGNGYYGRSGLNFFNNDFRFYGITGISFSWNIGGSYSSIHQKRQIQTGMEILENQRELFTLGLQTQCQQQKQEIFKFRSLIEKDDEIVAIRSEVRQVAAVQCENGTIVASDYLIKLDAESQALLNRNIHKIQLAMAYVKYQTTIGE